MPSTQTVEFRAVTGQTVTAKLFAAGSDTEVASVTATEQTNRKGTYRAAFTDIAAGEYQLLAFNATPIPVASWWVTLTLTTATFGVYDKADTRDIVVDTQDIQSRLPAALVSGRIDATVGAMAANTITASALATDALEEIADASGGSVTVAPLQATAPNRVAGTEVVTYINDTSDIGPIVVIDGDGDAVDLSALTLKVCVEKVDGTVLANITPSISGAGNNQVTFTPTSDCVVKTGTFRWSLRKTSNNQVYALGDFVVDPAARISS